MRGKYRIRCGNRRLFYAVVIGFEVLQSAGWFLMTASVKELEQWVVLTVIILVAAFGGLGISLTQRFRRLFDYTLQIENYDDELVLKSKYHDLTTKKVDVTSVEHDAILRSYRRRNRNSFFRTYETAYYTIGYYLRVRYAGKTLKLTSALSEFHNNDYYSPMKNLVFMFRGEQVPRCKRLTKFMMRDEDISQLSCNIDIGKIKPKRCVAVVMSIAAVTWFVFYALENKGIPVEILGFVQWLVIMFTAFVIVTLSIFREKKPSELIADFYEDYFTTFLNGKTATYRYQDIENAYIFEPNSRFFPTHSSSACLRITESDGEITDYYLTSYGFKRNATALESEERKSAKAVADEITYRVKLNSIERWEMEN